jgi:hypothetical protein
MIRTSSPGDTGFICARIYAFTQSAAMGCCSPTMVGRGGACREDAGKQSFSFPVLLLVLSIRGERERERSGGDDRFWWRFPRQDASKLGVHPMVRGGRLWDDGDRMNKPEMLQLKP